MALRFLDCGISSLEYDWRFQQLGTCMWDLKGENELRERLESYGFETEATKFIWLLEYRDGRYSQNPLTRWDLIMPD